MLKFSKQKCLIEMITFSFLDCVTRDKHINIDEVTHRRKDTWQYPDIEFNTITLKTNLDSHIGLVS